MKQIIIKSINDVILYDLMIKSDKKIIDIYIKINEINDNCYYCLICDDKILDYELSIYDIDIIYLVKKTKYIYTDLPFNYILLDDIKYIDNFNYDDNYNGFDIIKITEYEKKTLGCNCKHYILCEHNNYIKFIEIKRCCNIHILSYNKICDNCKNHYINTLYILFICLLSSSNKQVDVYYTEYGDKILYKYRELIIEKFCEFSIEYENE